MRGLHLLSSGGINTVFAGDMLTLSALEEQRNRPWAGRLQLEPKAKSPGGGIWEATDPTSKWTVVQELVAYLRQRKGMIKSRHEKTETTAVAAAATASCSQHRLAEQACGSASHSQPEEQVKHIGRSHCLQQASTNIARGAVLATASHQDFAKSPIVPEKQETMGSQTGFAEFDLPDVQCGSSWLFSLSYPIGTI
ncbi:hypothetical protein llap_13377 [Limosa lapponica baueri]|uniref:Uncharacterized protein n=1 Tax=Limosa lapponica baueri TaxID=1758121 RepID=A0A2I0TR87_LIMLA|nr:hypothetical protein llap_13377 [Limosa lapponica baueri]